MDKNTLFAKTVAGREALATRPAGLGPRLRSLLIMVDGKRNLAEFAKLSGTEGTAAGLLTELLDAGWIEMVGVDGLPKVATAPAATPDALPVGATAFQPEASQPLPMAVTAVPASWPFSDARRQVVRFINDQLGPMGETLAIRVEGCRTPADLQAALPRIREGLKTIKGAAVVQRFDEELAGRLPRV